MQPTVGRMVYYKAFGSVGGKYPPANRAAVVTDVQTKPGNGTGAEGEPMLFQCRLAVLNPTGMFFTEWLDQGQEGGQWDWMPFQKDQQARLAKEEETKA